MKNKELNLRVCLALTEPMARKLDRMAIKAGISRSSAMRELIAIARSEQLNNIPPRRRNQYTPWNDRVGRPTRG